MTEDVSSTNPFTLNVRLNPNWLRDLKKDFKSEVIEPCSRRVQNATEANEYIRDEKEFTRVRNEIINSLFVKLKELYGSSDQPGKAIMEELVIQLSYVYPNMFQDCQGL